jgi:hypothetical protein
MKCCSRGQELSGDLYGGGIGARTGSPSRRLIERSLEWTMQQLGVVDKTPQDWSGRLY